ncbi:MAG TPA: prephenate dehydratase [Acidimicrobiales bacterium]|jgi:prephenate dehydratase
MEARDRSVAFFGPAGTFTEEALLTQADLAAATLVPKSMIEDVLFAVASGEVDCGFIPLENAIEGTVNSTLDGLVFDVDLRIVREVVMDIHLHLMAPAGTSLKDVRAVLSFPHALSQCRRFLAATLPDAAVVAAQSTADAARQLGASRDAATAAIAPRLAASLYGLELLCERIEDYPDNQTRFVLVARSGVPAPSGHDRTSIVCFQGDDRPGSLYGILGQFAARSINLTKLESRPAKTGLGTYCFVIEFDGHVADEVVGNCLTELRASVAEVKFLGSYSTAGDGAEARREAFASRRDVARTWVDALLAEEQVWG